MKRDWVAIRIGYEAGTQSLDSIAAEQGIHPSTVRNRAAKEKWRQKRDKNATSIIEKATNTVIDERAVQITNGNRRDVTCADDALGHAHAMLSGADKAQDVLALVSAMAKAALMRRLALGQTTESMDANVNLTMLAQIIMPGKLKRGKQ